MANRKAVVKCVKSLLIGFGLNVLASGAGAQTEGFAAGQEPSDTVEHLLSRAVEALHHKNYKGRFTYEFGSVLETLEVVHLVENGLVRERILHLSGKKREFLRASGQDCLTIGGLILLGKGDAGPQARASLSQFYSFRIGTQERVAGRQATLVQISPRDEFRYGYTIAFDQESGLPLLSLLGNRQNTIERFQFIDLQVGEAVVAEDLEPRVGPYQAIEGEDSKNCVKQLANRAPRDKLQAMGDWRVNWLPDGFVLSEADSGEHFESVMTFTDGLAAFTVFISDVNPFEPQINNGIARRGATLALISNAQYGHDIKNIAIVGEVPFATAKRVLLSVAPLR